MKKYNDENYQQVIKELEDTIKTLPFVEKAGVILVEDEIPMAPLHVDDILPEENFSTYEEVSVKGRDSIPESINDVCQHQVRKPAVSYGGDLVIQPGQPATLQEILWNAAKQYGDHGITYVYTDGSEGFQSYKDLLQEAEKVLAGLQKLGLKPGDPVIFQFKDNKKFVTSFWACILGGFLPTPVAVAPIYTEMNAVINKLYNSWKLLSKPLILTELDLEEKLSMLEELWNEPSLRIETFQRLSESPANHDWFEATDESFVLNLLTSGSTGIPKCVQHRNKSIIWRTIATSVKNKFNHEDISLNWMPLDHVGGIVMFHVRDVYLGCNQILGHIDHIIQKPLTWLDWIDRYRATITWAPNFAFSMLNDAIAETGEKSWNLSSMNYLLNGGEAVVAKVAQQFLTLLEPFHLPGNAIVPAYGMSETSSGIVESKNLSRDSISGLNMIDKRSLSGVVRRVSGDDVNQVVFTESGEPLPGVRLRITDRDNQILNEGIIGRLQVKSPSVMNGYYKNEEANKEVFTEDGWFDTGDLGFLMDGRLTVTGRAKDVIIMNGNNYYNYDIEAVVEEIEGIEVTFAAACAIPDEQGVDQLAIFFVPDRHHAKNIMPLIQTIKQALSRKFGLNPKIIIPLSKEIFPKTNSGKIQRNDLIQRYKAKEYQAITREIDLLLENDYTFPDWIYKSDWTICDSPPLGKEKIVLTANTIVFTEWQEEHEENREHEAVYVKKGNQFRRIDAQHYEINAHHQEDYQKLLDSVLEDREKIDQIIHLWNIETGHKEIGNLHELKESQYNSSYSLMFLIQALNKHVHDKMDLYVVTKNAVPVYENEQISFETSTITGLIKTIPHELPHITGKQIDLNEEDKEYVYNYLKQEASIRDQHSVLAYRNKQRMIPAIKKVDLLSGRNRTSPLKTHGFYLVTGGLGGIGKIVCEHLLKRYQANILIIGRTLLCTGNGKEQSQKTKIFEDLKKQESFGGQVFYETADLTDKDHLSKLIADYEGSLAKELDGVIHLAGIIQECLLLDQTHELLEEMYEAKVYGTWVLHQILKEKKEAVFISTSSARTITSGMTVGAYCSANQFNETFAIYQNQFPYLNAYCFSWSQWDDLGMGKGLMIKEVLKHRGYTPIEERKGLYSFLAGLKLGEPTLYVGLNGAKKEIQELSQSNIEPNYKWKVYLQMDLEQDQLEQTLKACRETAAASLDLLDFPIELERKDELPLNSYGEVDKKALLELHKSEDIRDCAPRNQLDLVLVECWKRILDSKKISIHDSFFDLGGNSLQATQLLSAIQNEVGIKLELEDLFYKPKLSDLSDLIDECIQLERTNIHAKIPSREYGEIVPMSSSQKRQWFLYELEPNNPFYNNTVIIDLKGAVNRERIEKSLTSIVYRHETLRTTFDEINEQPSQIIHKEASIALQVKDFLIERKEPNVEVIDSFIREESMKPFDLVEGPVCRFNLLKIGEDEWKLIVTIHHIVSDGWSIGVFVDEFSKLYHSYGQAYQATGVLEIQYADYSLWQAEWVKSEDYLKQLSYWREQLSGSLPILDLPTDKPRPAIQTYSGKIETMMLDKDLTQKIRQLANKEESTIYMVLLAGFAALLKRYSNQEEMIVGSLFANRNRVEVEPLIGFFTNTLPLKFNCEGTFRKFLSQVKTTVLEAQANQDVQFEQLLDEAGIERDPGRHPLFQTMFVVQNAPIKPVSTDELEMDVSIYYNETSKFDLSMQIFEIQNELKVILEFNTDLFEEATIIRLLEHYKNILTGAVESSENRVDEYPIVTEKERGSLANWSSEEHESDFLRRETIIHHFENCAATYPEKCALVYKGKEMTYREVNEQSNNLARLLQNQGIEQEEIIGIMSERSFEMVIGILAVLKAGGAYMPIDPNFPIERISYMLENSQAKRVMAQMKFSQQIASDVSIIDLDDRNIYTGDGESPAININPNQLAYVIYTSGSTGNPKGVMVEHSSVLNIIIDLQEKYPLEENDAYLLKTPITFDVSVAELFGWFHSGGRLVILEQGAEKEPLAILNAIDRHHITHINFVPSMLSAFINTLQDQEFNVLNKLKYVFVAGEALPVELVKQFFQLTERVQLENIYGPTESTIYATHHSLKRSDIQTTIPIGTPMKNIKTYIVNPSNQLQPIGVVGELCIGGAGIARGYLNNTELTNEKFVDNPYSPGEKMYRTGDLARWSQNRTIEYLGRIDHQVKIRGIRIELGEIESAIKQNELVKDCVVSAISDSKGLKRLAAYIVLRTKENIDWVTYLNDLLPEYMIPNYFMVMDVLPTNNSGKIDRKSLPIPNLSLINDSNDYSEPVGEMESEMASIWQDLLGVKQIGRTDDFFKLGGDSIAVIQMISRLRKQGYQLEPKLVYVNKTIAQLSKKIVKTKSVPVVSQSAVKGEVRLTPIQKWFFEQNFSEANHWNLPALICFKQSYSLEVFKQALIAIVNHHDALRLTFSQDEDHWTQTNAGIVEDIQLNVIDCSVLSDSEQESMILEISSNAQRSLKLEEGLLLKPLLFQCNDGSQKLFLAAHHLVMDGVSWRIIAEDLELSLNHLAQGNTPVLPSKTTSYKEWAEAQYQYAESDEIKEELTYWNSIIEEQSPFLSEIPGESGTEGEAESIKIVLSETYTKKIMRTANSAYNTEMNDLLLAALYRAAKISTGNQSLSLMLEGHGRENIVEGLDLTRTVGWFTSAFPLVIKGAADASIGDQIKLVKETIRSIPAKGIGFGILNYLRKRNELEGGAYKAPQILFNYLGQMDSNSSEGKVLLAHPSTGDFHSPAAKRAYAVEINSMVIDGRLEADISLNRELANNPKIKTFIAAFEQELIEIVDHCLDPVNKGFTASDFPLVALGQELLDQLPKTTEDVYPLSPMQQGMLYHALADDETSSYNGRILVTLEGKIDQKLINRAWKHVIERHPILRTTYAWEGVQSPIQIVQQNTEGLVEFSSYKAQAEKEILIQDFLKKPFHLNQEAPLRIMIVSDQSEKSQLVWNFHHIALDGWSVFILLSELLDIYDQLTKKQEFHLPGVPAYKDYIEWYLAQDKEKAQDFWSSYLKGFKDATPLPGVTEEESGNGRDIIKTTFTIPEEVTTVITEFTKKEQHTLNTLLQAAWGILLGRYTGMEDIVYGCTVSGRPHSIEDVERMVGIFINSLPLRVELQPERMVKDLLSSLQETTLDIKEYEYTLLPDIQEVSEIPFGQPLFQSLLIYQNYPVDPEMRNPDRNVVLSGIQGTVDINYNLILEAAPRDKSILFEIYYNQGLWSQDFIERLFLHFQSTLLELIAKYEQTIHDISILTDAERTMILDDFSKTAKVEVLYEDQAEIYHGINLPERETEIYILDEQCRPVPVGIIGEIYLSSDDIYTDCGSWAEWMEENCIEDPFSQSQAKKLYKTGDLGLWEKDGSIRIIELT